MPGFRSSHPIEEFSFAEWQKMLAIHSDGAFSHHAAPASSSMYASAGGGSIIFMGSVHSKEASVLKAPYVHREATA